MPNMLDDGAVWLAGELKDHAGTAVAYSREGVSVSVTGTRSLAEHEVDDGGEGFSTRYQIHEWIFTAADLVLSGATIEPVPGDEITKGSGATAEVYRAMPPNDTEPCFAKVDTAGTMVKVYTKKVK